ncbi:DUF427 domain-containing protein [Streptomyces sp. R44]|uniref:DUF427 domain-containing protein n=1 Tax=Streptomyces sp. R44 TaxID=3238633 RepID=A0AB39SPL1_9ACTN
MSGTADAGGGRPKERAEGYPRPPRVVPDGRRVTVIHGGVVIVDSRRSLRVLETHHPPTFYIPPTDVRIDLLSLSPHATFCEWKGVATYWNLTGSNLLVPNVAWSYEDPSPGYAELTGHIAFYPGRVNECTVGGELVRPQPGSFYGGWITSEIEGPFKGDTMNTTH